MSWLDIITSKTLNMLILAGFSIFYIVILIATLAWAYEPGNLDIAAFIFALLPLIIILAGVLGYGLKAKFPGGEIEYYPVDRIMQPPSTILGERTIAEAEELMERKGVDFLNVVDKMGRFRGVFTKADAHKARKNRKVGEKIENLMTPLESIVKAQRGEKLINVMERIGKSKHSRLPVVDGDKVIGVIDSVDIQDFIAKTLKEA